MAPALLTTEREEMPPQTIERKSPFDETLPSTSPRGKSSIGAAIATLAQDNPFADEPTQVVHFPVERNKPATPSRDAEPPQALGELDDRITKARMSERRREGRLQRARAELASLSEAVRADLERLTKLEQKLAQRQRLLEETIAKVQSLEEERDSDRSAREALEALKTHYAQRK